MCSYNGEISVKQNVLFTVVYEFAQELCFWKTYFLYRRIVAQHGFISDKFDCPHNIFVQSKIET